MIPVVIMLARGGTFYKIKEMAVSIPSLHFQPPTPAFDEHSTDSRSHRVKCACKEIPGNGAFHTLVKNRYFFNLTSKRLTLYTVRKCKLFLRLIFLRKQARAPPPQKGGKEARSETNEGLLQ